MQTACKLYIALLQFLISFQHLEAISSGSRFYKFPPLSTQEPHSVGERGDHVPPAMPEGSAHTSLGSTLILKEIHISVPNAALYM
jgi:hypothetical protein